jgi:hypothetical protein
MPAGDAAPDPVGDAQLPFHDEVPQVMQQLGPGPGELFHPVATPSSRSMTE